VKTLWLTSLVMLAAAGSAHAFGHLTASCDAPCNGLCTPRMSVTWVEQTITDYKTEWEKKPIEVWVEQPVTKVVPKTYKRTEYELAYIDRKDVRTVIATVPRAAMKEITTYKMEPCTTTDPCTGQCHTTYSVKTCIENIPVTAYQCIERKEPVTVTTAYMKPVEKTYTVLDTVIEYKKVKLIKEELCPKQVPFQRTIQVPVYVPCGESAAVESKTLPPPVVDKPLK
jgi:hypothetical protein